MRGIKIPLHDFALKMQGGGGLMREGGRICGTLRYIGGRVYWGKAYRVGNRYLQREATSSEVIAKLN